MTIAKLDASNHDIYTKVEFARARDENNKNAKSEFYFVEKSGDVGAPDKLAAR
jgi:hypothetical protein